MAKPLALITGASSGIGSVFARELAARGYDLILVARRQDRLEALAGDLGGGTAAVTLAADLATDAGMDQTAARIAAEPALELLVNNAGFGLKGRFWETPVEEQQRMQRVHIDATLRLTHAALRAMVPRDRGGVISVSSVAAYARSQSNVGYCASKGWINDFTEGLYLELRGAKSNVKVQALCPGFTYTEFHEAMGVDRNKIPQRLWMKAGDVVEASLKGLADGKLFVVPGFLYQMTAAVMPKVPVGMRLWLESASPHTRDRLKRADA